VRQVISRNDAFQIIARARETAHNASPIEDLLNDYGTTRVVDAIREAYAGVSNGYLSQVCEVISGLRLEVTGEPESRYPCPCCNKRTLSETFNPVTGTGYDVCDHCGWEDDGTSNDQDYSSVNRGTIAEYRSRLLQE
jgi:hypothetical protein